MSATERTRIDGPLRLAVICQLKSLRVHTIVGIVGLDGVVRAFEVLAAAEAHAKILIDPQSDAVSP